MAIRTIAAGFVLFGVALMSTPSASQEAFTAKQVRIIIGFAPGGGYDQYARLVGRYIDRHLPGDPTIVPQNMPGGGSITAANYIANIAPKDGSVFGIIARDAAIQPLIRENSGAEFDATKLSWIGTASSETYVCVASDKSRVTSYDALLKQELILGSAGAGSGTDSIPRALNGLLGTKFKVIGGYPGSSEVFLAIGRGEVEGICSSYSAVMIKYADAVNAGRYKLLFQASLKPNPDIRAPFLLDKATTRKQRQALEFLFAGQSLGRPFIAPPELPPAILRTLRSGFDATVHDPDFLKQAAKQKLDIDPADGTELQAIVRGIYATPKPMIEKVKRVTKVP